MMLEQVWRNVIGDKFPYTYEDGKIRFTIPRGHDIKLYNLGLMLLDIENALNIHIKMESVINEEGLLQFTLLEDTAHRETDEVTSKQTSSRTSKKKD